MLPQFRSQLLVGEDVGDNYAKVTHNLTSDQIENPLMLGNPVILSSATSFRLLQINTLRPGKERFAYI